MRLPILCAALLLAATTITPLRAEGPPTEILPTPTNSTSRIPPSPFQNPDPAHYLFEDQIRPGMKGYGLTVMHAGNIEKFQFEVIDVIKNLSPGNNAVLIRCSGLGLEHSGIIAGMSGSPCYIDDKMIGAVAYGWSFSKDPIGGVQPIRQMLNIPVDEKAPAPAAGGAGGARWAEDIPFTRHAAAGPYGPLVKNLAQRNRPAGPLAEARNWHADHRALGLQPLASPLMVGGGNDSTCDLLGTMLAHTRLVPIASGSAGATPDAKDALGGIAQLKPNEIQLAPGSAIALPLLTGDLDLSAIGTVTEVRGTRVYAFGHAMFAEGRSQLPMATSYIYTIMPNVQQSFKMGSSLQLQGSLVMDEQTAIVGVLGKKTATVPVTITIQSADGLVHHTYHYQLAPHPKLTPEILTAALNESLTAQRGLPKYFTLKLRGNATFDGAAGPTQLNLQQSDTNLGFNPMQATLPIALLNDNPFENLNLTGVDLTLDIEPANRSGSIKSIALSRLAVAPGDQVTATVEIEPWHAQPRKIPITIKIPADAPEGQFQFTVGSAASALMEETSYAPQRFDPQNITAMVAAINHILSYREDKLYAVLVLDITGTALHGRELSDLPPSRLTRFASDRRTDTNPVFRTESVTVDAGGILLSGGQSFTLTIDKHANDRYYKPKTNPFGGSLGGSLTTPKLNLSAPSQPAPPQDPDN